MRKMTLLLLVALATPAVAAGPQAFSVRVVGQGKPMILIPGLASPGDVWNGTAEHFKDRYECHILTLAGFAGQPPINRPLLPAARKQIAAYIRRNHLERPVLVGHSLGGFLALAVASDDPGLVGAVVSVDGAPFLPALMNPGASVYKMQPQAAMIRKSIGAMTQEQYAENSRASLASMITSPEVAAAVAAKSGRSHPATVADAMADMMTTDLRSQMKKITAPVLLVGTAGPRVAAAYESQIASIPKHRFVLAEKSRHFVMLDDPDFLFAEMESFLR